MQDLRITLVQSELVWENVDANLAMFERLLSPLEQQTDLIILPEMFTTGFTMNARALAEEINGRSVNWMRDRARELGADITGSLIIREAGRYFNRLCWAKPDGRLFTYDKRHLFWMAGEEKVFTPGTKVITVPLLGWKLRPYICYDLRFPAWNRNTVEDARRSVLAYDVAIFVANWPVPRVAHWRALLLARAIENQAYVIGVNRLGEDQSQNQYSGNSSAIAPDGRVLFEVANEPVVHTVTLPAADLLHYRQKFPFWRDADSWAWQ